MTLLPVAAVAVVALRRDEVLLVRRGKEPHLGRWSFPGGSIEPGEAARAAARREVLEETGLSVRVLEAVDVFDSVHEPRPGVPGFHYCIGEFLAVPEDDAEPSARTDAAEARWVPLGRLAEYQPTEAMLAVLDRALEAFRRRFPADAGPRASIEGLYVVTDDTLVPGRSHRDVAAAALAGGARVIQLRDKRRPTGELVALARDLLALTRAAGAALIVNDRVDVAAAARADGVHLGVGDLPVACARRLLGPLPLIGFSPETTGEALDAARDGADYLGVGPIFGTRTKDDAGPAVGTGRIAELAAATGLPVVAIGGITVANAPEVVRAGARGAAVVSAVAAAPDMEAAARRLARALEKPMAS